MVFHEWAQAQEHIEKTNHQVKKVSGDENEK